MSPVLPPPAPATAPPEAAAHASPPCVLTFNANDPSGAGGLPADLTAMSSASCHVLAIATGCYVRDTRSIHHHIALDDELIDDQARCVLEDITPQAIKVGFVGNADNLGTIAELLSDYAHIPVVCYLPDLTWWDEVERENYLDALAERVLPQTSVLVGNHHTLSRWLLPDWAHDRPPLAREIAAAAAVHGVPYTLVTGFNAPDLYLESHLAAPETLLASARFERFDATFSGAGDTLSAVLCALLAGETDLQTACAEALTYLDQCLVAGFQPGMGHAIPNRLFWALDDDEPPEGAADPDDPTAGPAQQLEAFPTPSRTH